MKLVHMHIQMWFQSVPIFGYYRKMDHSSRMPMPRAHLFSNYLVTS
jgi:hypothetical protein